MFVICLWNYNVLNLQIFSYFWNVQILKTFVYNFSSLFNFICKTHETSNGHPSHISPGEWCGLLLLSLNGEGRGDGHLFHLFEEGGKGLLFLLKETRRGDVHFSILNIEGEWMGTFSHFSKGEGCGHFPLRFKGGGWGHHRLSKEEKDGCFSCVSAGGRGGHLARLFVC